MKHLQNPEYSFLILPSYPGVTSYLYSREYNLFELKSYLAGKFENCYLAFTSVEPIELRKDALHLLEHFIPGNLWVKYQGDEAIRLLYASGGEVPHSILEYNTNPALTSYIYNGISFSFQEAMEYYFPSQKSDLKSGMIIECLTTKGWERKKINNVDEEYQRSYQLLMKYQKMRVSRQKVF